MATKRSYADMMAELQELLIALQSSTIDIDAALAKYERGQKLVEELQVYLKTAENKISHSVAAHHNKVEA